MKESPGKEQGAASDRMGDGQGPGLSDGQDVLDEIALILADEDGNLVNDELQQDLGKYLGVVQEFLTHTKTDDPQLLSRVAINIAWAYDALESVTDTSTLTRDQEVDLRALIGGLAEKAEQKGVKGQDTFGHGSSRWVV